MSKRYELTVKCPKCGKSLFAEEVFEGGVKPHSPRQFHVFCVDCIDQIGHVLFEIADRAFVDIGDEKEAIVIAGTSMADALCIDYHETHDTRCPPKHGCAGTETFTEFSKIQRHDGPQEHIGQYVHGKFVEVSDVITAREEEQGKVMKLVRETCEKHGHAVMGKVLADALQAFYVKDVLTVNPIGADGKECGWQG